MKIRRFAIASMAASLLFGTAHAQSVPELLQKGIYNQETVGDLDSAIRIYRQVLSAKPESRAVAGEAQFRLGQSLLKKGDNAAATDAFQKVVKDYADQKELAAKAQEYLPGDLKLLPIPWSPNETDEYTIKLPGGQEVGTFLYSVEPAPGRPQNLLLQLRGYQFGMPQRLSRVEVDADTMRPVSSSFFINPIVSDTRIDYAGGEARVQIKGKDPKTVALNGGAFDNEEYAFLIRRVPLAPGYKTSLSLLSPLGVLIKFAPEVTGIEDVEVGAGKLHCYRLDVKMLHYTYWVEVDPPHRLAKMDEGGASVELARVGTLDKVTPVHYQDAKIGLSFNADPGWIVRANDVPQADQTSVRMLDPEVQAFVMLVGKQEKIDKIQITQKLQTDMDEGVKAETKQLKDYHLRPDSVQTRQIGGQQAISTVADYMDSSSGPMVEYVIDIRTENTKAAFITHMAASDLAAFQKRFDPMVNTIQLK